MRIIQKEIDKITAAPKALMVLQNIGEVPTYHETYSVRPPLASYNVSLSQVVQRILVTLEVLEQTQNIRDFDGPGNKDWEIPLIEATDHMLDSLIEHIDDCGGILRSFFPSKNDSNYKKLLKEFKSAVAPYRDHIGKVVNYMKHNQGRIRSISFSWPGGSSLGYYVEGPTKGGGLGPVSIIHANESTAFSYNRDIPYHLCNLYAVSANLATILHSVDKRLVPGKKQTVSIDKPTALAQALETAASLPMIFFEDEVRKGVPKITVSGRGFTIDFPANKAKPITPPGGSRIGVSVKGDGVTSKFTMPYYDNKN